MPNNSLRQIYGVASLSLRESCMSSPDSLWPRTVISPDLCKLDSGKGKMDLINRIDLLRKKESSSHWKPAFLFKVHQFRLGEVCHCLLRWVGTRQAKRLNKRTVNPSLHNLHIFAQTLPELLRSVYSTRLWQIRDEKYGMKTNRKQKEN